MRTSVYIHHGGVFFGGIEPYGQYHPEEQVGHSVGGLDGAAGNLGDAETLFLPGVGGREEVHGFPLGRLYQVYAPGHRGTAPRVDDPAAVGAAGGAVHAFLVAQRGGLPCLHAHGIEAGIARVALVAPVDYAFLPGVESYHLLHHPRPAGELPGQSAVHVQHNIIPIVLILVNHFYILAFLSNDEQMTVRVANGLCRNVLN